MARNHSIEAASIALEFNAPKVEFASGIVQSTDLSPSALAFVLRYGFKQLLSDAMAGKAKEGGPEAAKAAAEAKLASILDGTVGVRAASEGRSAKVKTLEDFIAIVAKEKITAQAKAKDMKAPTGDKLKELIARVSGNASIVADATERFRLHSEAASLDLGLSDDDFAMPEAEAETVDAESEAPTEG
jgi:hypothetical protein